MLSTTVSLPDDPRVDIMATPRSQPGGRLRLAREDKGPHVHFSAWSTTSRQRPEGERRLESGPAAGERIGRATAGAWRGRWRGFGDIRPPGAQPAAVERAGGRRARSGRAAAGDRNRKHESSRQAAGDGNRSGIAAGRENRSAYRMHARRSLAREKVAMDELRRGTA
jgi:hypothetical protein